MSEDIEQLEWVPIGLTCIEYPKGDLIGKLFAYSCLTPFFILSSFVTLIFFRRDLHTIFYFFGILMNELCNFILKNAIQDPRPHRDGVRALFDHYGMPSSHAQFMWFFAVYLVLFVSLRVHAMGTKMYRDVTCRVIAALVAIMVACFVCYSRIYLVYHSWPQVVCGSILGSVLAAIWFLIVHVLLTPLFPLMLHNMFAEWLLLRDLTLIPHIMWFEYVQARSEAKTRQRKTQ
jgi:dolichyldiphosphatase